MATLNCEKDPDLEAVGLDLIGDCEDPLADVECPEDNEYEDITDCCAQNIRDLAKRDDYLLCLIAAQNETIRNLCETVGCETFVGGPTNFAEADNQDDLELQDTTICVSKEITLTRDITSYTSSVMIFKAGGSIITNGFQHYCNSRVIANPYQHIFQVQKPGDVYGSLGWVPRTPEWFGAIGKSNVADAAANWLGIESAIKCTWTEDRTINGNQSWVDTGKSYSYGWQVKNDRSPTDSEQILYFCKQAHTSNTDNDEPGIGANWQNYWEVILDSNSFKRGTRVSRVIMYSSIYYIDRPIDARDYMFTLEHVSEGGNIAHSSHIETVDSAEWSKTEHIHVDDQYPAGTVPMIRLGSRQIVRDDDAFAGVVNTFGIKLKYLYLRHTTANGPDVRISCITITGSFEEGCEIYNVSGSGFWGYGIGAHRNTIVNGAEFHNLHLNSHSVVSDELTLPFSMSGATYSVHNCSFNNWLANRANYCARVGGKAVFMHTIHCERPKLAGIQVHWNFFGTSDNSGTNGAHPKIHISSVDGDPFDNATAAVVSISAGVSAVKLENINRFEDGPIIEDAARGVSSDGTKPHSFNPGGAILEYTRQPDYTDPEDYHVITSDPALKLKSAEILDPSGGATVDAEARAAINDILDLLQQRDLMD